VGEVVPQVLEGKVLDHFPVVFGGLSLECPEPAVDPFFGQPLAALRRKHVSTRWVASGLQVGIQRLAGLIQQIDITPLASLM